MISRIPASPHQGDSNSNVKSVADLRATPARRLPEVDKSKVDPRVREAAEGMEALFIDHLFQVMRQSVPKSEMDLESPATQIYRGMLDSEYAHKAAQAGGVGLADQIIAYWEGQRYNQSAGKGGGHGAQSTPIVRTERTGGTHEGQSSRSAGQLSRSEE